MNPSNPRLPSCLRDKARGLVSYAIKSGQMVRPPICEGSGEHRGGIEAHHADYNKPLDVKWLCKACHSAAHRGAPKQLNQAQSIDTATPGDAFITTGEAAVILGVERRSVGYMIARGILPATRVGRYWVVEQGHVVQAAKRTDRRRKANVTKPVTDESLPEEALRDHRTEKVPAELDEAARKTVETRKEPNES